MTVFFICEQSISTHDAGEKARDDLTTVLQSMNAKPLTIHRCREKGKIDRLLSIPMVRHDWSSVAAHVQKGDTLVIQYPPQMYPKVSLAALPSLRAMKNNGAKLCFFIHDIDCLRGNSAEGPDAQWLANADVIIAHNQVMIDRLRTLNLSCPMVDLQIFDYLADDNIPNDSINRVPGIAIAGNLNRNKSGYIYHLAHDLPSANFQLFGPNFDGDAIERQWYHGSVSPEELPKAMNAQFGLVWDGDSLQTCTGRFGEYLRFNNPHKLSLYLASGMPVFIWDQAAEAQFVERNHLGFAISSIADAVYMAENIDADIYKTYQKNVSAMQKRLHRGFYTTHALQQAFATLRP